MGKLKIGKYDVFRHRNFFNPNKVRGTDEEIFSQIWLWHKNKIINTKKWKLSIQL
jgi:hypothetical protein